LAALDLCEKGTDLRQRLRENSAFFRAGLEKAGFKVLPGSHPIIPVMIGDSALAKTMADRLLGEGVYVIAFSYPVVPQGLARIRTQMSAALQRSDLEAALEAFAKVGKDVGVLK
jgi:glycine C-acetyltransferase